MRRSFLVLFFLSTMPVTLVKAQVDPEEKLVLAAVQAFFDSMAAADSVASSEVLLFDGHFYATRMEAEGVSVRHSTVQDYLASISKNPNQYLERMWNPEVAVNRWLATVTTPYDFHINGEFSHCGTDVFNLVRQDGRWKIASIIYTVEPANCPGSPLGEPE